MYKAIAANKRNTVLVMFMFVLIISAIGALVAWIFQDQWIAVWMVAFSIAYAVIQFFVASKLALSLRC